MTTVAAPRMTVEEFLALPDDGIERDLINGRVGEYGESITRRNFRHTRTEATVAQLLKNWLDRQPQPRGEILSGEVGVRLGRDDRTSVGVDVVYISAELAKATPEDARLIEGPPILAVEILSPSDKQEDILDKVRAYLDAGVGVVWVIEPVFRTVSVYHASAAPVMYNATQELSGDPHLAGFRTPVSALFEC